MNIRAYQKELRESHVPKQTWTRLEELEGGLAEIPTLGLPLCHIPVSWPPGVLSELSEYEHGKTVPEDARSAGLAIAIVDASTLGDMIDPVFSNLSAQELCTPQIELVFSASAGDIHIQATLVCSVAILLRSVRRKGPLSLTFL